MDVLTLLGNHAFPVVACVAMGWYVVRMDTRHEKEVSALREAVDNNTVAIVKLVERMEKNNDN